MYCETCGRGPWACACGLSFADKLRTVQIHGSVYETRSKRNYIDRWALADTFGADAEERMREETHGLGPAYSTKDGLMRRTSDGPKPVSEKEMREYVRGVEAADVV